MGDFLVSNVAFSSSLVTVSRVLWLSECSVDLHWPYLHGIIDHKILRHLVWKYISFTFPCINYITIARFPQEGAAYQCGLLYRFVVAQVCGGGVYITLKKGLCSFLKKRENKPIILELEVVIVENYINTYL